MLLKIMYALNVVVIFVLLITLILETNEWKLYGLIALAMISQVLVVISDQKKKDRK